MYLMPCVEFDLCVHTANALFRHSILYKLKTIPLSGCYPEGGGKIDERWNTGPYFEISMLYLRRNHKVRYSIYH